MFAITSHAADLRLRFPHQRHRATGIVVAVEGKLRRPHRVHQLARAAQQGAALIQLLVLAGFQLRPFQLPDLIGQGVHPPGALRFVHFQRVDLAAQGGKLLVGGLIIAQKTLGAPEAVQIPQVAGGVEQLLPVVLTVDIQKLTPHLPQLGDGDQLAIDPADIASVGLDLSLQQQLVPLDDAVFFQPGQLLHPGEHTVYQRRLGSGADQLPAGALAQHRADGIHHDGFTRTGLAGQHIKARIKLDIRRLDQGNIFNMEQREHTLSPFLSVYTLIQTACEPRC